MAKLDLQPIERTTLDLRPVGTVAFPSRDTDNASTFGDTTLPAIDIPEIADPSAPPEGFVPTIPKDVKIIPEQFPKEQFPHGVLVPAPEKTFWQKTKGFFVGEPKYGRWTEPTRQDYLHRAIGIPVNIITKLSGARALGADKLLWYTISKIRPDLADRPLEEQINELNPIEQSGLNKLSGDIAEFIGQIQSATKLLGAIGLKSPTGTRFIDRVASKAPPWMTSGAIEAIVEGVTREKDAKQIAKDVAINSLIRGGEAIVWSGVEVGAGKLFGWAMNKFPRFRAGWGKWAKGKSSEQVRPARAEVDEALRIYKETGNRTAWDNVRIKYAGITPEGIQRIRARAAPPPPVKDFGKFPITKAVRPPPAIAPVQPAFEKRGVKPAEGIIIPPKPTQAKPEAPPPIDITQEPPGKPTAEFGESFIKRVTRRAEAGLRVGKEYETPKSLVPLEKEAVSKLKTAVQLSQKEKAVITREKKAFQRQRVAQAHRFLKIEKAKGELSAEERLAATVKFFKGEQFAKQRWQPIELDQKTRNSMHEYIETHQGFGLHTKRNTSEALNKLFDGYYLTNHEVAYITDVFPELGKVAAKRRPPRNKGFDIFMSVLGFPKSIRAAFDISLLGRQMYPLLLAKPSLIAPGTRESLKLFFRKESAAAAIALSAEMRADPAWKRAEDMGVEVIKPGELSEEFPTRVAGKIPGIARSERAFVQTGNLLRIAAHDMIENIYIERGKPLSDDASKAMAQAINDLSGRSALPKNLKGLSTVASAVMWSPRLVLARGKAPFRAFSKQRAARNLTIRSFTTMASLVTLLMLLAKYGHERNEDIDGELNPISTDFGKIRYKNQHIDTTGGYGPMIRTVARTITGMTKTATGEISKKGRIETLKQFGRAKTAPVIGFARKVITQQDWLGRPAFRAPSGTIGEAMTELGIPEAGQIVAKEIYEELLPLPMVDVADAAYIDGWASGLIAAPLAFGGIGTLAYEQAESTKLRIEQNKVAQRVHGKNWDELGPLQQRFLRKEPSLLEQQLKADVEDLYQRQEGEIDKVRYKMYRSMSLPIRKELNSIGVAISAPARKSGDFRMNDARYKYYVDTSTTLMKSAFKREFALPYWQNKSTLLGFKQKRANQIMTNAKTRARNEVKRLSNEGKL